MRSIRAMTIKPLAQLRQDCVTVVAASIFFLGFSWRKLWVARMGVLLISLLVFIWAYAVAHYPCTLCGIKLAEVEEVHELQNQVNGWTVTAV